MNGKVVIFCEDHIQNQLLTELVETRVGCTCVAVASLEAALRECRDDALLLVDLCTPGLDQFPDWVQLVQRCDAYPSIALLNAAPEMNCEAAVTISHVKGLFYKTVPVDELVKGIGALLHGAYWLSQRVLQRLLETLPTVRTDSYDRYTSLTGREARILGLIAEGHSNTFIAQKLCLSVHTVKTHAYNLFRKIGASNRVQAARFARGCEGFGSAASRPVAESWR